MSERRDIREAKERFEARLRREGASPDWARQKAREIALQRDRAAARKERDDG